jgi:hypothetical protein
VNATPDVDGYATIDKMWATKKDENNDLLGMLN